MNNFDLVIFDIDGTLLDTTQYVYLAFKSSLFIHTGEEMTWEQVAPVLGKPLEECYKILSKLEVVENLMEEHLKFQTVEENLQLVTSYPNVIEVLSTLTDNNIRIAAVTSRGGENMHKTLKLGGIDSYLEMLVTDKDVLMHKPDPEGILKVLSKLGVSPDRAIMVGDTSADVLAGKNAGIKTVGVTYGFHGVKVSNSMPDFLVDDITQILPIILS